MSELRDQVDVAYQAWNAAFNSGDPKAVAAAYLEDAKLLPPTHAVLSGPAEVEQFFAGIFANCITGHALKIIEVGGDGNIVFAAANWNAMATGAEGKVQAIGGIATHIFERQSDGGLKLKLHTFN
jgi:uncharacterized protein (TIGR02246 family)